MPSADRERKTSWSQGQILTPEAALAFRLVAEDDLASRFPLVITHDCDLAAALDREPSAEILIGRSIDRLGSATNAKIARRLELALQGETGSRAMELLAPDKRTIPKETLFEYAPRKDLWLAPSDRRILQGWLAARYHRAAFPEAFENRLRRQVGIRAVEPRFHLGLEEINRACEREPPDERNAEEAGVEVPAPHGSEIEPGLTFLARCGSHCATAGLITKLAACDCPCANLNTIVTRSPTLSEWRGPKSIRW